ncbi:MAG: hypothetical protein Q8867_03085 [Bacteroidota bacterium]|nr:hypothetical protein [Bacteroidota bacterium]
MATINIFLVGNDKVVSREVKAKLPANGYVVTGMEEKGEKALAALLKNSQENLPNVVVIDCPGEQIFHLLPSAKTLSQDGSCGIVFLSTPSLRDKIFQKWTDEPPIWVEKPTTPVLLKNAIDLACYFSFLKQLYLKADQQLKNELRLHKKDSRARETMEKDLINRELANSSLYNSEKNKILSLLRKELLKHIRDKNEIDKDEIGFIINSIDKKVVFDSDWFRLKALFEKSYPGFFDRLREKFPQLTPNDHKLCALLRMNMNTKEISQVLKITAPSTEISRIRLRKKLELQKNVNLIHFIASI